ncbi:hypothetical protein ACH4UR_25370 [Streptomyces lydicus]|uniref:hypothetical protein n=1 Tax=Streptomyces lydicus TaxID=47763 RepID=UPI0037944620
MLVQHRAKNGAVREYDFATLAVAPAMRRSLAAVFAVKCAPGGGWNSHDSSKQIWHLLREFARFLAEQTDAPKDIPELTAGTWMAWRLSRPQNQAGYVQITAVAGFLQLDARLPQPVRAAMAKRVPRVKVKEHAYAPEEFQQIRLAARRTFRSALLRIRENTQSLRAWREGAITERDSPEWLVGEALDALAQTGHVPRYVGTDDRQRVISRYARALGGENSKYTWQRLYLSRREAASLGVLLTAEHGFNATTVGTMSTPRATPDSGEGQFPVYRLELKKSRKGHADHFETRNLTDFGADSPGRLITEALEATGPARAYLASVGCTVDRLLVWHEARTRDWQASDTLLREGPFGLGLTKADFEDWGHRDGPTGKSPMRRTRKTANVVHRREPGQDGAAGGLQRLEVCRMNRDAEATDPTPEGLARLKEYVDGRQSRGEAIPTWYRSGRQTPAAPYLSAVTGASLSQVRNLFRTGSRRQYVLARPGGCPLPVPVTGRVDGHPWTEAIDFNEIESLMRHLGTACFIVLTYLTGMRPGEVLGLRTGCCPDPETEDGPHLIHGHVYKNATDEDGNHLSLGTLREVPWVAIAPVVQAIRVLEKIVPAGALLFDAAAHDFTLKRAFSGSITLTTLGDRIESFAAWATDQATRLGRTHETVPDDPHGALGTRRFRRTLAWHIARRPGGLVALAIQYGHMRTAVSVGYASRSREGIHDLLDVETARATVDTLATLHEDLADGTGISGPAARRAINAAAQAPAFAGAVIDAKAAKAILDNPQLAVYDNPGSYLMCVYNRDKALCHRLDGPQEAPSLDRCQPSCANISRTDHHADQLVGLAETLEKKAGSELVPGPLADRFRHRAARLRAVADEHRHNRISTPEDPS